jgi:ubiquinone/menaquinone biosynthesis C-methylase UbiE
MVAKEKLHVMSQTGPKPASRNNQAHLKNKSSARQSLSVALTASSAQFARDHRDRNAPEETMTQAQAIRQDPTAHQGAPAAIPDLAALKNRQQMAWSSGDYAVVGTTLQIVGEQLCEALDLRSGQKVLDVAAGNGNVSLAAAHRWCDVISTDYVPSLLERGRARASAEGLTVEFKEADAEALPFADGTFDAVVSTFGVMFTPNQNQAAAELLRACKSGGKIGLANWTPEGFIGQVFKTLGKYMPPPAGVKSPALWGTRERLVEMFGSAAISIETAPRNFNFRYRSTEHFLEVFRTYYGPMLKAFAALDETKQSGLKDDLHALVARMNKARDGTMVVPSEYLEVVITKR